MANFLLHYFAIYRYFQQMKALPTSKNGLKIGLLGSGQLARMLALQAHAMGLVPYVYGGKSDDPAAQVTAFYTPGDLKDSKKLEEFLRKVDVATFESEFMDGELLKSLSEKTGTPVFPKPQTMESLQDRLTQKSLLEKNKLPTSPFLKVSTLEELEVAQKKFSKTGFVLKKRKFGYDGYGTFLVRNSKELENIKPLLDKTPEGFIAEAFVKFKRELAISAVRNQKGEVAFLPLVESFQKDSRCFWVKGPVIHPKLKALKTKIKSFLNSLDYVGIIAFELFDTKNLVINEIAPRVHNSAHYSLDGLSKDQFELHLEAILNRRLKDPAPLAKAFAMVNLLGSHTNAPQWTELPQGRMHWYGKKENRPGRKMGHINFLSTSSSKALETALKTLKEIDL